MEHRAYRLHTYDADPSTQPGLGHTPGDVWLLELWVENIYYPDKEVLKRKTHFLENNEPLK